MILGPWARFLAKRSALAPEPFDIPIGKCARVGAPRVGAGDRVYLAAFGLVRAYGILLRRALMVDGWHLLIDGRPGLHVPVTAAGPIKTGWFDGWRDPWWDVKQQQEWPQGFAWQRMGVPPDALIDLDGSSVPILGSVAPPPQAPVLATAIVCSRGRGGARCEVVKVPADERMKNAPDPMEAPARAAPPAPRPKRPGGAPSAAAPPKQAPAAPQLGLFGSAPAPRRPS